MAQKAAALLLSYAPGLQTSDCIDSGGRRNRERPVGERFFIFFSGKATLDLSNLTGKRSRDRGFISITKLRMPRLAISSLFCSLAVRNEDPARDDMASFLRRRDRTGRDCQQPYGNFPPGAKVGCTGAAMWRQPRVCFATHRDCLTVRTRAPGMPFCG